MKETNENLVKSQLKLIIATDKLLKNRKLLLTKPYQLPMLGE